MLTHFEYEIKQKWRSKNKQTNKHVYLYMYPFLDHITISMFVSVLGQPNEVTKRLDCWKPITGKFTVNS